MNPKDEILLRFIVVGLCLFKLREKPTRKMDIFVVLYCLSWAAGLRVLYFVLPECISCVYTSLGCILLSTVLGCRLYQTFKAAYFTERVIPFKKAVFITGCDSGFGHELAKRLNSKDFLVFAGCLFPDGDGAKKLSELSSGRLHVVGIDVRKDESVLAARNYLQTNLGDADLWAVVNNAGIFKGNDVALTKVDYFEESLKVNTLGPVRVTKAFLPMLFKSKGRVVTVTSLASRAAFPHISTYTMSKYAARAFCETLRQEMHPWGVKVIEIEPEAFTTPMADLDTVFAMLDNVANATDEDIKSLYGDEYWERLKDFLRKNKGVASPRVYRVVDDLEDAVSLLEPCNVYTPSRNTITNVGLTIFKNMPSSMIDSIFRLNERISNHPIPKAAKK